MDNVSWLKVRQKMKKDLIQLRDKVYNMDGDLMANGYFLPIEEICLLPCAMEAEKKLLDAAVEVAEEYEQNARRMVLDEALDGLVSVWGDEIPGFKDAVLNGRKDVLLSLRGQIKRSIEIIKIDGGDYEA